MADLLDFHLEQKPSVEEILQSYKDYLVVEDYAATTVRDYISFSRQFLLFLQIDLSDLNILHIIQYKSELQDKQKLKAASVNKKLMVIKNLLGWMFDTNLIQVDISRKVKLLKRQGRGSAPKGLTAKEVDKLLQFAGMSKELFRNRNYVILSIMLNAGLRVSEAANLKYGDIQLNERSGYILVRKGKGNKERVVPVSGKLKTRLNEYFDERMGEKKIPIGIDEPVFMSERKGHLSVRTIQHMIQYFANRANITRINVTPHTLRHTFANNYYQSSGRDIVSLANLMGHDSLDTTAIYALPSEEQVLLNLDKL
jgi:site-specific recombinase XerD